MARIDFYILKQLLTLFGFFALVLVLIYWINRAVALFDQLIADGQSAFVFLEFTALSLPTIIALIMPMAAFAAVLYVVNRLSSESELTVVQASGFSAARLARPIWVFGSLVVVLMLFLNHFLVPSSQAQLQERSRAIAENVTARLLTEGQFLTPGDGITFYLRAITPDGQLESVFLNDASTPNRDVTYSASKAFLVRSEAGPRLVLIDGQVQDLDKLTDRLTVTEFNDFVINIGQLIGPQTETGVSVQNHSSLELWRQMRAPSPPADFDRDAVSFEFNDRNTEALLALAAALVGFATLISGGFSRFGIWRHILVAILFLIVIKVVEGFVVDAIRTSPRTLFLIYLPFIVGLAIAYVLILRSDRPWAKTGTQL